MKTISNLILAFLFLTFGCSSQPTRANIILKKIKSVTQTINDQDDSTKKITIINYYGIKGNDSLEYYNGELLFRFTVELDPEERVASLIRYDSKNREDEWHIYKYERNGYYTIEIMAQGAGTISLAKYDKANRCVEDEIESSYKILYNYNRLGNLEKILFKNKNNQPRIIGIITYDKDGLAIKAEGLGEEKKMTYFKSNNKGLVSEMKTFYKQKSGNEKTEVILFEYEFYD